MDDDPKSQFVIPGVRRKRETERKSSFLLVSRVTAGKKEREKKERKKILGPPKRKQYSYTYAYTYPLSLCLVPLYPYILTFWVCAQK